MDDNKQEEKTEKRLMLTPDGAFAVEGSAEQISRFEDSVRRYLAG